MFHDSMIAAIRTGVAALVGSLVAYLISQGLDLDESFAVNLTTAMTILAIAGYNYFVIILEKKVNPKFGYLLGVPKTPSYNK